MMKTGKTIILTSARGLAMFCARSAIQRSGSALSWFVSEAVVAPVPKPWLRQKKGRGAQR